MSTVEMDTVDSTFPAGPRAPVDACAGGGNAGIDKAAVLK